MDRGRGRRPFRHRGVPLHRRRPSRRFRRPRLSGTARTAPTCLHQHVRRSRRRLRRSDARRVPPHPGRVRHRRSPLLARDGAPAPPRRRRPARPHRPADPGRPAAGRLPAARARHHRPAAHRRADQPDAHARPPTSWPAARCAHALLHTVIAPQRLQPCRLLRDSTAHWLTPSRALEQDLPAADRHRYASTTAAARAQDVRTAAGNSRRRSRDLAAEAAERSAVRLPHALHEQISGRLNDLR
ncbi:hypothetical protein ACSNOK_21165 [Streptomyces sp. URMC 126]|uniref:hypothetical protein n=1 Tax=Streptomyces sp. URMC 126 TaxID=3423401 RepID=UPI003F1C0574